MSLVQTTRSESIVSEEIVPADAVLFGEFCEILEILQKKKKKYEKKNILEKFISDFRLKTASIMNKKNTTFFPILRLLLPKHERERSAYNMKETKLGALIVKVLSFDKNSRDAQKLMNFKSVQNNSQDSDLAGVAFFILKSRLGLTSSKLTIGDINKVLDCIATAEVGNKGPILEEAFGYVMRNLTASQVKWFLRIILKNLKLGLSSTQILAAFHPDAPDHYAVCSNLSKVCEELEDGDSRPVELGVRVCLAVTPMLSERLDVTDVHQLPPDNTYHVENKFDGERFQRQRNKQLQVEYEFEGRAAGEDFNDTRQAIVISAEEIHMENNSFEYFSRKGHAYSSKYGKSYECGLFTPELKGCFDPSVTSFILDGEMMGWHKERQCFGSKGMSFDIKKITESSKYKPCFCAFDVLYYNGKSLAGPPEKGGLKLTERLEILDSMFEDIPGVIVHSQRETVNSSLDVLDALNRAIEDDEEGIVVKDVASYYIPSKRNAGWYKIKPEYTDGALVDLDLVIIGADVSENKKKGPANSFHVACVDTSGPDPCWVCVGRVANGLSHEQCASLCAALQRHWVAAARVPPPPNLRFTRKRPDYWLLPEHSTVLQVRATELVRCEGGGGAAGLGYALRFPRVACERRDKPPRDATTLADLVALVQYKGAVVKLSTTRIDKEQVKEGAAGVGARRGVKRTAKVLRVADEFRSEGRAGGAAGVEGAGGVQSQALRGRKVCVLSDDEGGAAGRRELIALVEAHGGVHVANPGADTWCCVAGRREHVSRLGAGGGEERWDVARARWLRSLRAAPRPCSLAPRDLLAATARTRLALAATHDPHGDHYTEPADGDALRDCFRDMDDHGIHTYLTIGEMLDVDEQLFGDHNPHSFLRACFIHMPNERSLEALRASRYAANLCGRDSPNISHVVVAGSERADRIEELRRGTSAVLVTMAWLDACFEQGRLVSETPFLL